MHRTDHAPRRPDAESPPTPLGTDVRRRLRKRLRAETAEEADGALLLTTYDVIWACGFDHSPSERPVGLWVPVDGATPVLFVPLLEREHAATVPDVEIETYLEFPGVRHPVLEMADGIRARAHGAEVRIAVDAVDLRVAEALRAAGHDLVASDGAARARGVKEPEELDLIRAAARYADAVLFRLHELGGAAIADGASELDLLEACLTPVRAAMRAELGDRFASTAMHVVGTVHAAAQAALPHGRPGSTRPKSGDVVIAGIGAKVGGYHAESGATFVVDGPDREVARCLEVADACGRAAAAAVRPGVACDRVNEAGWNVVLEAGLGDHLRHRIGHGMGVDGHEPPWLAPGDATEIRPGMTFSDEPGIYRPGRDGVRTIDTLIVHDHATEIPSRFQATVPWDRRILSTDASR